MKKIILVLSALLSTTSFADSWRQIETNDLLCVAKKDRVSLNLSILITATAGDRTPGSFSKVGVTKIFISSGAQARVQKQILNNEALVVASEGNAFILQVSFELGYNLSLGGEGLDKVLTDNKRSHTVDLNGTLTLFDDNVVYDLKCSGTIR